MKKESTVEEKYALWKKSNKIEENDEVKKLLEKIGDTRGCDDCECCTSG